MIPSRGLCPVVVDLVRNDRIRNPTGGGTMKIFRCSVCHSAMSPLTQIYRERKPIVWACHFGCGQWAVDQDELQKRETAAVAEERKQVSCAHEQDTGSV